MKYLFQNKKRIAVGLLIVLMNNLLTPCMSYALTSGPSEPETKGFQPAGVTDMVDLASGSFKYNIPLLDIDGYPINLDYASGTGIDDEASWVGLGWNLNPGAINRQVRGIPDDFSGDTIEVDHHVKPNVTVGGRAYFKFEAKGIAFGSVSVGLFNNNYTGVGAEIGANPGISFSLLNDGGLTAGLGLGVSSSTQSGVSLSPTVNLSIGDNISDNFTARANFGASLGYNSRSGLKSLTLGASFEPEIKGGDYYPNPQVPANPGSEYAQSASYDIGGSTISYNTEPISPSVLVPFSSTNNTFSVNAGPAFYGTFPSLGGTGYRTVKQVKDPVTVKPGFGFLYAERGKNNGDAVMDFVREKDNPIVDGIPNIAIPIHTPDIWTFSSQAGSGQFRLYRGGSGAFFDNQSSDVSVDNSDGADLGGGLYFHGGVTKFTQTTSNNTHKWQNNNAFLAKGDFQNATTTRPDSENVFFRETGEKGLADQEINTQTYGTQPIAVNISGMNAGASYRLSGNAAVAQQTLAKTSRRKNCTVISYLTAQEASVGGLDEGINSYAFNTDTANSYLSEPVINKTAPRVDAFHKSHHISEITVTDNGGKRLVYGIPVYNYTQDEYSFAVGGTGRTGGKYPLTNQVPVPSNPAANNLGVDNYYHRDHKGAYATSFLLTAILSPDYVDKTGNGISDDDLGTAIKFNYSRLPKPYKWRSPYVNATLDRGLLADPDDDKGSIVYGQKEVWYVQSIESKTKIAYFITAERNDDLGVVNWQSGGPDATLKQRYLKQIRLYSKADMSKPIKVVNFAYSYDLCRGVPNSLNGGGKLTLTKVWFTYGNSDQGKYHPYKFAYNKSISTDTAVHYNYMVTDRWGTYKKATENSGGLTNEEYPYSDQNRAVADQNVALWHLNEIDLPTGGKINITYESGDYAYVQDKKATAMTGAISLIDGSLNPVDTLSLYNAKGVSINIGNTLTVPGNGDITQWFKDNFLNGSNYLYTKFCVQLAVPSNSNPQGCLYDFVPCYAEIKSVSISGSTAKVLFKDISQSGVTVNPISIAAWQRIKNDYPRYAYPGFDNRVQTANNSVLAAVSAIVSAAKNLSELTQNFYQKASKNHYASRVFISKSFVKIAKVDGHKLGGAARVKRITINDEWSSMSGSNIASAQYGQAYDYTTTEGNLTISSGVATYEPAVGGDENALKEPVPYDENVKGAITNYFDIEKPFCESLYPAPEITYSRVTVRDLDQSGNPSQKTGYIVNEYYTSKDFPVKVNVLPVQAFHPQPSSHYSLTSSTSIDNMSLSQGYSIELNDMNAKQKAVYVYNQSGGTISSTVYNYNVDSNGALNNHVDVIGQDGVVVHNQVLGREIEFYTDFREQVSNNNGKTINIGADIFPFGFFPIPFFLPHFPTGDNTDVKTFRSACALKVIQTYGLLNNVVKTENGSSITTKNIAYDGLTGEPMVTQTQNEFNKTIYSVNLPAYWAYTGMGPAYQNLGIYLSHFTTNSHGEIATGYAGYLKGGDELVDFAGNHLWVIDNQAYSGTGNTKKLINRGGVLIKSYTSVNPIKIVRSGFRNMLSASTGSVVCLNNPLVTIGGVTSLQLKQNTDLTSLKVINASATTYDENWSEENNVCQQVNTDPTINPIENNAMNFSFSKTKAWPGGVAIRKSIDTAVYTTVYSKYWGDYDTLYTGRRKLVGFWPSIKLNNDGDNTYFGFDAVVNFSESKVYYFYFSSYYTIGVTIDCPSQTLGMSGDGANMEPVYITAGKHILHCSTKYGDIFDAPPTAGFEIYDNTYNELVNADSVGTGLKVIYSTRAFSTTDSIYSYIDYDGFSTSDRYSSDQIYHFLRQDGSPMFYNYSYCSSPPYATKLINPYTTGFLGNWRPYQTKVYQQTRNNTNVTTATKTGANIKATGYINNFYSYWYYNSDIWTPNTTATRWVTANTVTLYDKYGQQLENKDALGRYSAAMFAFNGELPSAVASNAMNREIYTASLEDNKFLPGKSTTDTCNVREFTEPSTGLNINKFADSTISHTGNYSAKLPSDGLTMATVIDTNHQKTQPYLSLDTAKQYITKTTGDLYPNGFEPSPGTNYVFDAWVYDNTPNDKSINLTLQMNGTAIPLKCKAVVEGWKLLEGIINIGSLPSGTALNLSIVPNSGFTINVDDIRLHPFNAQMKTYAYDDKTMRLMAELDENGFATFYEYDDEGLLIRVKKETERGVMTLKESRSSYKKIQ